MPITYYNVERQISKKAWEPIALGLTCLPDAKDAALRGRAGLREFGAPYTTRIVECTVVETFEPSKEVARA